MRKLRRSLVLVRPTERFLRWLDEAVEDEHFSEEEVRSDCSAYLIPAVADEATLEAALREHHEEIFAEELQDWVIDIQRWPAHRGYEVFREWFEVTLASSVRDLLD